MKVAILGGTQSYSSMFIRAGFHLSPIKDADILCFTGGADVNPKLYGQDMHPRTFKDDSRDEIDTSAYNYALEFGKPCVGICRGAQFLNVVNAGKLYQHVDGHAIGGTHKALDLHTGDVINVSSTHHQMMSPSDRGEVILVAEGVSSYREYLNDKGIIRQEGSHKDVEAVFYKDTSTLCFQPHPEINQGIECRDYFFSLIERYLK